MRLIEWNNYYDAKLYWHPRTQHMCRPANTGCDKGPWWGKLVEPFRSTCLLLSAISFVPLASCEQSRDSNENGSIGHEVAIPAEFSPENCMETHFPLAASVAAPPEVRFYCAAPWNKETFESVRSALDAADVDLTRVIVGMVPPDKKAALEAAVPFALREADKGPPGMGNVYRLQKLLPFLWAIRTGSDQDVLNEFAPEDLEALKAAEARIDWSLPAVDAEAVSMESAIKSEAKLSDVPQVILAGAY